MAGAFLLSKKALLIWACLSVLVSISTAQTSYTWNGTTDTDFATATNWTPNGVPGSVDIITIDTAMNNPVLDQNRTVDEINLNTDAQLDLGGYTLTVTTDADLNAGTITNGEFVMTSGKSDLNGVEMDCGVTISNHIHKLSNSEFKEYTSLTQTNSTSLRTGGNIFRDTVEIIKTGGAYWDLGYWDPDTFLAPLSCSLESASGHLRLSNNTTGNYYADVVTLNNYSGSTSNHFYIGYLYSSSTFEDDVIMNVDSVSGNISWSSGEHVHKGDLLVGDDGYHSGTLMLNSYLHEGTGVIDLRDLDHNAKLTIGANRVFEGDFYGPEVETSIKQDCHFKGYVELAGIKEWKKGNTFDKRVQFTLPNYVNTGGNYFKDTVNFDILGGNVTFGNGAPDTFLAPVTFNLEAAKDVWLAISGLADYYQDRVTINNHSGAINDGFYLNGGTFDDDIVLNVDSTSGFINFFYQGTHNGRLLIGEEGYHSGKLTLGFQHTSSEVMDLSAMDHNSTLHVKSDADIAADFIYSGPGSATLTDAVFRGATSVSATSLAVNRCSFLASANLNKTGTGNNYNGGNVFYGETTIENSSDANFIHFGFNSPDTFLTDLTLINRSNKVLRLNFNTSCSLKHNLTLDGDSASAIRLGDSDAGDILVFNGTTDQHINILNEDLNVEAYRLEVNKSAGRLKLNNDLTVTKELKLTNGIVEFTNDAILTFTNNATSAANDTSYVEGKVKKIGNDAFEFPIGQTDLHRPISFSAPASTIDQFTAKLHRANPKRIIGDSLATGINFISTLEYFEVDQLAGSSDVQWTLGWDEADNYSGFNTSELRILGWNGTYWADLGAGTLTGDTVSGTLQSSGTIDLDTYEYLTLGSANGSMFSGVHEDGIISDEGNTGGNGLGDLMILDPPGAHPLSLYWNDTVYPAVNDLSGLVEASRSDTIFGVSGDSLLREALFVDSVQQGILGYARKDRLADRYTLKIVDAQPDSVEVKLTVGHSLSARESVGLELTGNSVLKTGSDGWDSGFMVMENFIDSAEVGGIQFVVDDVVSELAVGFKLFNDTLEDGYDDMQYALLVDSGVVSIMFPGTTYVNVDTVKTGDLLRFERALVNGGGDSKEFRYSCNDSIVRNIAVSAKDILVGKIALKSSGSSLSKALGSGTFSVLSRRSRTQVTCQSPYSGSASFTLPGVDPSSLNYTYFGQGFVPSNITLISSNGGYSGVALNDLSPGTYGVSGQITYPNGVSGYMSSTERVGTRIEWEEMSNVQAVGNNLEKTASTDAWDSYGFSANELSAASEGWVEFTVDASVDRLAQSIGFTDEQSNSSLPWQDLRYGIIAVKWPYVGSNLNGYLYGVVVNGELALVDYAEANSVFLIEKDIDGGSPNIIFRRNESPIYIHQAAGFPEKLHVQADMYYQNNKFKGVSASFLCPEGEYYAASCDSTADHNWVSQKTFDGNGVVLAEAITYVDQLGRQVQQQQRVLTDSDILASQNIFDAFGRTAITTKAAPIGYSASFSYADDFVNNPDGDPYGYLDFDVPNYTGSSSALTSGEVDDPKALETSNSGTLGYYYSTNDTAEKYVAIADQPYGRVEFSADPSGTVQRTAQAGAELKMGSGHENRSFSMRTDGSELDSIYGVDKSYRVVKDSTDNLDSYPIAITGGKMNISKTVSRDADGSETVLYQSGALTIASCRSGLSNSCLTQSTTISLAPDGNRSADIHLPEATRGTLFLPWPTYSIASTQYTMDSDDISFAITDIERKKQLVEGTDYTINSSRKVVFSGDYASYSGSYFLRIRFDYTEVMEDVIDAGTVKPDPTEVMFKLDYSHWSLNYYDLAGKLRRTVTRKGFDCALATGANTMSSTYDYSPLGQLIGETLPDEGKKEFLYDDEGKLRFTQNAQQSADGKYSYVHYDRFGRPYESGEYTIPGSGGVYFQNYYEEFTICGGCSTTLDILDNTDGLSDTDCDYVTETHYYELETADAIPTSYTSDNADPFVQEYLLGRVSRTSNENTTTWYSYDQQGRTVFTLQQLDTDFSTDMDDRIKTTEYEYDATKGFLDKVKYQRFEPTEYAIHDFDYDSDNRLSEVKYTAPFPTDITNKTVAKYQYYPTGELRRVELDEEQGLDYLYTINGWLKGMNDPRMDTDDDPGGDGGTGSSFGQDYFGYTIDYFDGDYVGADNDLDSLNSASGNEFFSGLISAVRYRTNDNEARFIDHGGAEIEMLTASTEDHFMTRYTYDQNYQLATAVFGTYEAGSPFTFSATDHFKEFGPTSTGNAISYDINGNIDTLYRNGYNVGGDYAMDELVYTYSANTNSLASVDDDGTNSGTYGDFTATDATITYNSIGQMTSSPDEDVDDVDYHVNGKAEKVTLDASNDYIEYFYDDRGRRYKTVYNDYSNSNLNKTVWHVGGLSGSTLAIYEQATASSNVELEDMPIYGGRNRIGVYNHQSEIFQFEITDHTGSVRAVFEDDYGDVALKSWGDYYAFGGPQPGRTHNMAAYRYGYQGQEKAEGQDWDMFDLRMYNPHLGRWTTPDPYRQFSSAFNGMGNNPIMNVDPTGGLSFAWMQIIQAQNAAIESNNRMLANWHADQHAAFLGNLATSDIFSNAGGAPQQIGQINGNGSFSLVGDAAGNMSNEDIAALIDLGYLSPEQGAALALATQDDFVGNQVRVQIGTKLVHTYGAGGVSIDGKPEPIFASVAVAEHREMGGSLSNSASGVLLAGAVAGEGAAISTGGSVVVSGSAISMVLAGVLAGYTVEQLERRASEKTYVTYTKYNPVTMQYYVGRTSGEGTPQELVSKRDSQHGALNAAGFLPAQVDRFAKGVNSFVNGDGMVTGISAYAAIRGREQQLIDRFGGVGNPFVANTIRGVYRYNPLGRMYHVASTIYFGPAHSYTGY